MLNIATWDGEIVVYVYCDGPDDEPLEYRPDYYAIEYGSNGTPNLVLEWNDDKTMLLLCWLRERWVYVLKHGVYQEAKVTDPDGNLIGYSA